MNPNQLLQSWGFIECPFEANAAEEEKDILKHSFVRPPYFEELIGDTKKPRSSVVFGYRGEGKSALCEMIQFELENRLKGDTFVIPYDSFRISGSTNSNNTTISTHISRIIEIGIEKLIGKLEREPERMRELNSNEVPALEWMVLLYLSDTTYDQVEKRFIKLIDLLDSRKLYKRLSSKGYRRARSVLRR